MYVQLVPLFTLVFSFAVADHSSHRYRGTDEKLINYFRKQVFEIAICCTSEQTTCCLFAGKLKYNKWPRVLNFRWNKIAISDMTIGFFGVYKALKSFDRYLFFQYIRFTRLQRRPANITKIYHKLEQGQTIEYLLEVHRSNTINKCIRSFFYQPILDISDFVFWNSTLVTHHFSLKPRFFIFPH